MAQLENETIRLRALEPEDLELLYRWENNPELWSLGNTMSPYSRYILKEYIRESHRDIFDLKQLRLMIELRSTGAAIVLSTCTISNRIIGVPVSVFYWNLFIKETGWLPKQ